MHSVENGIAEAARQRIASADAQGVWSRMEDAAMRHMRSIAFGGAGAVMTLAVALSISDRPAPLPHDPIIVGSIVPAPRIAGAPHWQTIRRPAELIALQAPQLQRHTHEYLARQTASGDREDSLNFEAVRPDMPDARITLRRMAGPLLEPPSLFIDMTRQQAERGVAVTRAGTPGRLATKFGDLEAADMAISDSSGQSQSCIAFRQHGEVGIVGWYCAAQGEAVERPEVVCLLDRLSLVKAGEDKDLRKFFAEAEQRRMPCPTARLSTGRKPTWLESDGKAPAMRELAGGTGRTPGR